MSAFMFASTPPPSDYVKNDPHMFLSYHPERTSFQSGYLGISHTIVSGTLHVRFPEPVEAKSVSIKFIGRETVEWVDLKKVHGEKVIVDKSKYLWQSRNGTGAELVSDMDLPFEFEVPSDAMESFGSQFGNIAYTLRATVHRKPKKKRTWCEVVIPLWRWTVPDEEDMRPLVIKSPKRQRKVPLSWQAVLPQTFFDVNSDMLVKLRLIAYNPGLRVRKITACLKTYMTCSTNERGIVPVSRDKRHSKHEIPGRNIVMTPRGPENVFEANVVIKIPGNTPPTCKTRFISVKNQVQIKITFERSRHHVLIARDIVVGRNFMDDRSAAPLRESFELSDLSEAEK